MGPGGAEKLLDESLPIISSYPGYDVDLIVLNSKNTIFLDNIFDSDVRVFYSPYENSRNLKNIKFISDKIKKNQYDIVHAHLFSSIYFTSVVSFFDKSDRKYFATEHSTENRRRKNRILRPLEKFIYSNYDKVLSITKGTQVNLMKWLESTNLQKFPIVYNGVNLEKFYSAQKCSTEKLLESEDFNNIKTVCMVGSFSKKKDQSTIIKSLKYLPEDVHLVLVGAGPRKQELQEMTSRLKLNDRVHFLGIRSDVPEIYKTIDVAIVSSHSEGFGLVAVEAMAASKPVIASDVEGLREVVEGAGLLFEKGNDKELANCINELLEDARKYQKVSEKCFDRSKKYSIDKMVQEQIKIYKM